MRTSSARGTRPGDVTTAWPSAGTTAPFWHRADPMVQAVRIDPGFALLREEFPATWTLLVEVKSLLDGVAVLTAFSPEPGRGGSDRDRTARRMVGQAAALLRRAGAGERAAGRTYLAGSLDRQADTLSAFAGTGEWPGYLVDQPRSDEPWLYCGPLSTWAPRGRRFPLGLLVVRPEPAWQRWVDLVDEHLDAVRATAAEALGGPVRATSARPAMVAGTLVLAGGDTSLGHKNFAHFFPLETPGGSVAGPDFTVVFGNVHRARLAGCSLPLLDAFLGAPGRTDAGVDDVLGASLTWFRCHDLGHFWRRGPEPVPDSPPGRTDAFESMAFEEAYADTLGVLCARRVVDPALLNVAFNAELLRYLSRRASDFADSVAAGLEAAWFTRAGCPMPSASADWLDGQAGAALVRAIHAALWDAAGDRSAVGQLRGCLPGGRDLVERLAPLHATHPTDLIYTFG